MKLFTSAAKLLIATLLIGCGAEQSGSISSLQSNAQKANQSDAHSASINKKITTAVTLHDVGGWHHTHWKEGLYPTSISRVSNVVGANTVTVVDTHFVTKHTENGYKIVYQPHGSSWTNTPTDKQWRQIGGYADNHDLNLQMLVMLFSIGKHGVDLWGTRQDAHKTKDKVFWDSYFKQYSSLVSARAKVAQASGVDSIILGYGGAIDLAQKSDYWRDLIDSIRQVGFTGEIGLWSGLDVHGNWSGIQYAQNHSSHSNVSRSISYFDFIVLQTQDIEERLLKRALRSFKKYKKPIQIMVTTPSVTTGASPEKEYIEPLLRSSVAPQRELNLDVQKQAYQDVINIINDPQFDHVSGINSWGYHFRDDFFHGSVSGDSDYQKSASIRKKPAEELLAHWYREWE